MPRSAQWPISAASAARSSIVPEGLPGEATIRPSRAGGRQVGGHRLKPVPSAAVGMPTGSSDSAFRIWR